MAVRDDEPTEGERPPAMDRLARLLMGLGCVFMVVAPLLVIATIIYYVWVLEVGF